MKSRRLTPGEAALAREVFGDAVNIERVRLHPRGYGPFAVTLGRHVFIPAKDWREDFAVGQGSPWADLLGQAFLVHELVHVWQFQTRPLWTLRSWSKVAWAAGYGPGLPGYRYTLPITFDAFNLEQQASAVEHAFLFARGVTPAQAPKGASLKDYEGRTALPICTLAT